MAPEKQSTEAQRPKHMPELPTGRPNISGLLALAGAVLATVALFHGIAAD